MDWLLALLSACIGALAILLSPIDASSWRLVASRSGSDLRSKWHVRDHFGGISPWKAKTAGIVTDIDDIPPGCVIDQVHMMSRHAERYPTMLPGIRMLELYHRLQNTNATLPEAIAVASRADFYAPFPNEQFEQLTSTGPFAGTLQAFKAGTTFRTRYKGKYINSAGW
ncbi:3-phytase B [Pseudocercospora fuligena]|uniref:3-phytase B n=1 Tax=Pseudocercospora fuligena TaxID=685502 RepID=A0A8H6R875_9PEZI|nr:3-phytase B [Pseudocercospora fuligena]